MRFHFCSILPFIPFFLEILRYAADMSDHLAVLTRHRFDLTTSRCGCGPCRPSRSCSAGSLLLVQGPTSLKALRAALQPYCDSSLTGGLAKEITRGAALYTDTYIIYHETFTKQTCISSGRFHWFYWGKPQQFCGSSPEMDGTINVQSVMVIALK